MKSTQNSNKTSKKRNVQEWFIYGIIIGMGFSALVMQLLEMLK